MPDLVISSTPNSREHKRRQLTRGQIRMTMVTPSDNGQNSSNTSETRRTILRRFRLAEISRRKRTHWRSATFGRVLRDRVLEQAFVLRSPHLLTAGDQMPVEMRDG